MNRLCEANLGTAAGDLIADLAKDRDTRGDDAQPLWQAAVNLRDADRLIANGR